MNYSDTLVPMPARERNKQLAILVVVILLPIIFSVAGYMLQSIDFFWAVFCWLGAGLIIAVLLIPKILRAAKDDFFKNKIIYKGSLKEVRTVKIGYSTSSTLVYELVLEKAILKISEKDLIETKLLDVPLPIQNEEVEIHALPKSGDIIKLLVNRENEWKEVALV